VKKKKKEEEEERKKREEEDRKEREEEDRKEREEEEERKKREEEIKKKEEIQEIKEEERKMHKMCHMELATTLKNLENNTEDPQIRKIIEIYNPYTGKEPDFMKAQILSICDHWENKENKLKEIIKYIWPEVDIDLDNYEDAGKLTEIILMTIETFMPQQCKECNKLYIVKQGENPKIRCMWCKVGQHNCIKRGDEETLKGMMWLCRECDGLIQNQILPNIDITKKMEMIAKEEAMEYNFEGFTKKGNEENAGTKEKQEKKLVNKAKETVKPKEKRKEDRNNTGEGEISMDIGDEGNGVEGVSRPEEPVTIPKEKKECWHWINRSCRFGNRCRDKHTVLCREFVQWGKCRKVRCTVRHPVMCRNITEKNFCNMEGCLNRHPTRMRNEYKNENNQQRPNADNHGYNQQNYNNGQRGGPQMYNTGYNQHQMQNAQGRHMDNHNEYRNQQNNGHRDPRNTENFHYGDHQWPNLWEMKRMMSDMENIRRAFGMMNR